MFSNYKFYTDLLSNLPKKKLLINTINAHSFNLALENSDFKKALLSSNVLLPDGVGIILAELFINYRKIKKIAGEDIFKFEMQRLNACSGNCFFLGSSEDVLNKMVKRAGIDYPNIEIATYSPPYKTHFSTQDTEKMLDEVNASYSNVVFVGMTAPKQELWAHQNFNKINANRVICIGAVFDFYAETIKRAPKWMIFLGLEWIYRLLREPKRMWRRYLIGNVRFLIEIFRAKIIANK